MISAEHFCLHQEGRDAKKTNIKRKIFEQVL